MTVQDNERERELVRVFNLDWDPSHTRDGVDAFLSIEIDGIDYQFDVEVKSTTGGTVSTARDVGMEHIRKWRRQLFVIGYYSRDRGRPELKKCLCLTPVDMEPWIESVERKILIDFKIAACASRRLELEDLYEVCGRKSAYTLEDARRLHKQQWTADEYNLALDTIEDGQPRLSPNKMLEILQLRSKYVAERGATLNNPHITKSHLGLFLGTDREVMGTSWAESVRRVAREFVKSHPEHAAAVALAKTPDSISI